MIGDILIPRTLYLWSVGQRLVEENLIIHYGLKFPSKVNFLKIIYAFPLNHIATITIVEF